MLWQRIRGLWNTYHGILAVILTLVFWSYLAIVFVVFKPSEIQEFRRFVLYNLAAVAGLAVAAIRGRGTAPTMLAGGFVECHTLSLKQTVSVGVTILVVMLAAVDPPGSRLLKLTVLFGFLLALYVVFLICHLFLPRKLADLLFSEAHEQRTLLIGPVDKAGEIARWIQESAAFGFGMRGSVPDDESTESRILHITCVKDVPTLERIIKNEGIKQIILLELPLDKDGLKLVANTAKKTGVRLLVFNNLSEIFQDDITSFKVLDKNFIGLRNEPLEDPVNRILKRTMDIVVSLPVVVFVLPPLSILVKVFQAIQSPGPLFYRQTRAGLANRPFRPFTFRTTRVDKGDGASQQATDGDPRIYPMGRLLRKTSLDEMPRFLNVFFGHMSVVGPRPHTAVQNRRFSEIMEEYHVRTFAKPGVTGLAQMSGFRGEAKDDEDVVQSARLDIKYIENWSLPLDFWIIFKTMCQVVKPSKLA
jgi:putative colanic acid biosynthesis UDP-glucose lipid carrier transferase